MLLESVHVLVPMRTCAPSHRDYLDTHTSIKQGKVAIVGIERILIAAVDRDGVLLNGVSEKQLGCGITTTPDAHNSLHCIGSTSAN